MVGSVIAQPPSLAGLLTVGGVQYPDVAGPLAGGARALAWTHLAAPACWTDASQASGHSTAAAEPGFAQPSGLADADALASADNAAASWPGRVRCR
jgi:hypothetical protein